MVRNLIDESTMPADYIGTQDICDVASRPIIFEYVMQEVGCGRIEAVALVVPNGRFQLLQRGDGALPDNDAAGILSQTA